MSERVTVDGVHLRLASSVFKVRGVTYGSFRSRPDGARFPESTQIAADFLAMAKLGLNTLRTYEVPPSDLLDLAEVHDLRLIIGLHYPDWRMEPETGRSARRRIERAAWEAVNDALEHCAGRSCVLAIAVGNEVPADLVRLHGIRHVEDTLSRLVGAVHEADPGLLATYVSFPTTEYLEVEHQDLVCFNVFLERPEPLRRYLRHLQVVSGNRPLLLTELGLAAGVNGEQAQAQSLSSQLRIVDEVGCAGATVFSWTDDWAVGDRQVEGWGFGITTAERQAKPAVEVVSQWARSRLRLLRDTWPSVSVVVCAYNEEDTITECLESLARTQYPDLQVIVCIDGSTDRTLLRARQFPFQILELPHGGLSAARNAGLQAAWGEIVAFLDADATCHPDWAYHLALSLEDPEIAATGGPNLPCTDAGLVERAVAASPGNPVEVLIADDRAEHVPGCNMAFRKETLTSIGGFNPAYTCAGDDVDVCWRLIDQGKEIAFSAAAQVWHHRRSTVWGYLKQQVGYGRAERMLTGAHRHRFNLLGQARWTGVVYSGARLLPSLLRPIVYHGAQGTSLFQPVLRRRAEIAADWVGARLPLLLALALFGAALGRLSLWWVALPMGAIAALVAFAAAVAIGIRLNPREPHPVRVRALAGVLHVLQPFARMWGRLRVRGSTLALSPPLPTVWQGDRHQWLRDLRRELQARKVTVVIGDESQAWDLEARLGLFVAARLATAVLWSWQPSYRLRWRLRAPAQLLLALGAAWSITDPGVGVAGLATVSVVALAEGALLRARLGAALDRSTHGAGLWQASLARGRRRRD